MEQVAKDIPLTASAREVLELAQRFAAQVGATTVEPMHVLGAIAFLPRNPAGRALAELGADIARLQSPRARDDGNGTPASWKSVPIGSATRYLLNNAHREAEQLGHYRVDAVHILLGLLYKDSTSTAPVLEAAGVTFYALRQYLTTPSSGTRALGNRPLPSLDGAIGLSPVFAIPFGSMVVGGLGLFLGAPAAFTLPLSILLVVGGWVTSLCVHEFAHALVAYLGGDRSVASAGYLTLNPLKYTQPLVSIVLPLVFIFLGGIGLPGGAVYLNEGAIRNARWRSFASAAGPLSNLLFTLLIGWPFLISQGMPTVGDPRFWAAIAFLIFLQISAIILNLLPIPPFDGFGIIAPWLSIELRILASRVGMLPLLLLWFFLWQGGPVSAAFFGAISNLSGLLQVPDILIAIGHQQFLHGGVSG